MGYITINGGIINAEGNDLGAGIGCGGGLDEQCHGTITINGGTINAKGRYEAAAIGSGHLCSEDTTIITINGSSITATVENNYWQAAAIGNSYHAPSTVIINGGTINAESIGGDGGLPEYAATVTLNWINLTDNYTADVYRNCTVTLAKEFTNGLTFLPAGSVNTSALNGKTLTPPAGRNIFITDGNWNDAANWNNGTVPGSDGDAYVFAAATITNTDLVEANNITVGTDGSITIEDGGQLIHNNEGVVATVKKHIAGHGTTDLSGWNFIATPIAAGTTLLDRAYINFEEGNAIDKFMLNPDATKLYIPQGGKDYAIASVGGDGVHTVSTEIPVNFKASENGTYTITVNTDHVEMSYLHLIDNMTGNDVKTQKIVVK